MAGVRFKNRRWHVRYLDATGVRCERVTPATNKAEAKRFAAELEARTWKIRHGLEVAPDESGLTLGGLMDWWLANRSAGTASHSRNESAVRCHFGAAAIARLPLHTVTPACLEEFLRTKAADLSAGTANHLRGFVHAAFNSARRAGLYAGANPAADVPKFKVPHRLPDYLRKAEVVPLLGALSDKYRDLFACAIYAGLRKGELMALQKRDLDFEARLIRVRRSHGRNVPKEGDESALPMASELVPFLRAAVAASPSALVFPNDDGSRMRPDTKLEKILRSAMGRAGLVESWLHVCRHKGCGHRQRHDDDDLRHCPEHACKLWPKAQVRAIRFHDLRHTTASLMTMAGANPAAVQRVLRHGDPRITMQVYAHLAPGYLRDEVDRLRFFDDVSAAAEFAQAGGQVAFGRRLDVPHRPDAGATEPMPAAHSRPDGPHGVPVRAQSRPHPGARSRLVMHQKRST